jgi:hypothetical protein
LLLGQPGPAAGLFLALDQGAEQPAANCIWKQMKSLTLSTGGEVLWSQLA